MTWSAPLQRLGLELSTNRGSELSSMEAKLQSFIFFAILVDEVPQVPPAFTSPRWWSATCSCKPSIPLLPLYCLVSWGLSKKQKQIQDNFACHIFIESKYSVTCFSANLATTELGDAGFHKTGRFVDSSSGLLTVMMMLEDSWKKWRPQHKFFSYICFAISLPGRYF